MKRDHPNNNPRPNPNRHSPAIQNPPMATSSGAGARYPPAAKLWEECDGGDDELLATMGYKVRSSDMEDVALKLEQLDAMCSVQQDISQLASDSVHYNPSDLSTWLETMLSELAPPPNFDSVVAPTDDSAFLEYSSITSVDYSLHPHQRTTRSSQSHSHSYQNSCKTVVFEESCSSDYDLKAIPGKAIYNTTQNAARSSTQVDSSSSSSRESKRMRPSLGAEIAPSNDAVQVGESARRIVVVDSQENGIRLVHALMACAEAVQSNSLAIADALVKQINFLAASQAGAMRKVATFFAQALAWRIYGLYPEKPIADYSLSDILQMHFYEACPYLKFAHFTANQAILEAFQGKSRVHVIDFSMNHGMQWPALMQALARRPEGPPAFRLTGIGPPSHDNSDYLQEVGWKLAQLAETVNVDFEYRGFVANSLADLNASMLELRPSEVEAVAVNSVFELHKLLARPGAIEKVLSVVRQMRPEIVTVVEQEANHNGAVFLDRFTEALHYYSTMFDSLEGSARPGDDKVMSEVYLGNQIANVVAYEGFDRVERHETLEQWRERMGEAGFGAAHLGSNAFKQASTLLALYAGGDGYGVEENSGCLTLGWHTRPLIATSAWKLAAAAH